jgi:hypothetical protein
MAMKWLLLLFQLSGSRSIQHKRWSQSKLEVYSAPLQKIISLQGISACWICVLEKSGKYLSSSGSKPISYGQPQPPLVRCKIEVVSPRLRRIGTFQYIWSIRSLIRAFYESRQHRPVKWLARSRYRPAVCNTAASCAGCGRSYSILGIGWCRGAGRHPRPRLA